MRNILGISGILTLGALMCLAFLGASEPQPRSKLWPYVRRAHLQAEPFCRVCGSERDLEVHHEREFARYPELELTPANLITLCRHCHFSVGHLEVSWKTNNYEIAAAFGAVSNSTGRRVWAMRREKQ